MGSRKGKAWLPRWGWEELSQGTFLVVSAHHTAHPPRCPQSHLKSLVSLSGAPLQAGRWPCGRQDGAGVGGPKRQVHGGALPRWRLGDGRKGHFGSAGVREVDWLHLLALKNLGSHSRPGGFRFPRQPLPSTSLQPLADLRRPADPTSLLRPEVPSPAQPCPGCPEGKLGGEKSEERCRESWGEEPEERAGVKPWKGRRVRTCIGLSSLLTCSATAPLTCTHHLCHSSVSPHLSAFNLVESLLSPL